MDTIAADTSHTNFMAKTPEEKEAEKKAAEAKRIKDEEEAAELKAASDKVEAERLAKAEKLRLEKEAKEGTADQDRMYSKTEVLAFIKQAVVEARKKEEAGIDDSLDEEDPYKQKQVRIPRFQGKFILEFKNTNTDPYFPDQVVQAFDVWNDQTKRNDAWVTVVFDDKTTLSVPLYTVIEKSQKVWVDLVEVISKDTSYSAGRVERAEVKDYSRAGTGTFVKAKVIQADHKFKIKLPTTNEEVIVGKEVVNW